MTIAYPKVDVYSAPRTGKGTPNRMNVLETQEGPLDNSTKEGWQCHFNTLQKAVAVFEALDKSNWSGDFSEPWLIDADEGVKSLESCLYDILVFQARLFVGAILTS